MTIPPADDLDRPSARAAFALVMALTYADLAKTYPSPGEVNGTTLTDDEIIGVAEKFDALIRGERSTAIPNPTDPPVA